MMNNLLAIFLTAFLCCFTTISNAQLNLELLGQLDYQSLHNSDLSDIWGYVDEDGNEYAIVGVNDGGTSIVDVTDPANPVEVFFSAGPSTIWRDMKTWGDYAYITNESSGGLKIIDMSGLPEDTDLPVSFYDTGGWGSAHNLFIDEFGYCYIVGANRGNGGVIFLDLNDDPMNPVEVGEYDQFYVHDVVVKDNLMYLSHINNGFFQILDVTDKTSPQILGSQETSNTFTHNAWFSDDLNYLYTTDEVENAFIDAYDISDPGDIQFLDNIQSNPGTNTIVHNTHFIDDYLVTSYYRDGVTIHDVSCPDIMVEVGNYDTSPDFAGGGFNGCWGVYPWLPSGNIIASDIEEGLHILKPFYQRASFLAGTVIDASNSNPISGAEVQVVSTTTMDFTALNGEFGVGLVGAGTYDILVSKPGYMDETVTGIELTSGVKVVIEVELQPLTSFSFNGSTLDAFSNESISEIQVLIENDDFTLEGTSDGNGNFTFGAMFPGVYNIYAGQWGYITTCLEGVLIDELNNTVELTLEPGIYDDFTFDFNWENTATAPTGIWERDEPYGTTSFGNQSNPEFDVDGDCYDRCYVTGNANVDNGGTDDVDDGIVTLFSPVFDGTQFTSPVMQFYRWFANYDNTVADDNLVLMIDNGSITENLAIYNSQDNPSTWVLEEFILSDFIELSSTMRLIVETEDNFDNGSIVEAGIDLFSVVEGNVGLLESERLNFSIFPNPTQGLIQIQNPNRDAWNIRILDSKGALVSASKMNSSQLNLELDLEIGMYFVQFVNAQGYSQTEKLIVE